MAAYQRASIRLWKCEWDLSELQMSNGRQISMEEPNFCGRSSDRYLLSTIVSQTAWRLSVYGPIILPDHRAGPEQQLFTKPKFTCPSPCPLNHTQAIRGRSLTRRSVPGLYIGALSN